MPFPLHPKGPVSLKRSLQYVPVVICLIASTVAGSLQDLLESFRGAAHRCPDQYGEYSPDQEKFIDALNGKKIVFIGDSITRYALGLGRCKICEPDLAPTQFRIGMSPGFALARTANSLNEGIVCTRIGLFVFGGVCSVLLRTAGTNTSSWHRSSRTASV